MFVVLDISHYQRYFLYMHVLYMGLQYQQYLCLYQYLCLRLTCICQWRRTCGASGLWGRLRVDDSASRRSASEWREAAPPPRPGASCCARTRACHRGDQAGICTRCPGQSPRPAGRRCCRGDRSGCRQPTAPGNHAEGAPVTMATKRESQDVVVAVDMDTV